MSQIQTLAILALVALCAFSAVEAKDREGKVLSLFNVINFQNQDCRSTEKAGNTDHYRNGTCYTSEECDDKNGEKQGNCAAGFGVCCVFKIDTPGDEVKENCSYFTNPGFPAAYTGTPTAITHTLSKVNCDERICFFRLDFEAFTLHGPTDTTEPATNVCTDSLAITTTSTQRVAPICGENSGKHMYIEVLDTCNANAQVTMNVPTANRASTRRWDIKVTQIECDNPNKPPNGCLEYHTTPTGRITSFNFDATNGVHLSNQDQSVCIRDIKDGCCVRYSVCSATVADGSFSLDITTNDQSMVDGNCQEDYIRGNAFSNECKKNSASTVNRLCGRRLNAVTGLGSDVSVCDCQSDYRLTIITDNTADAANTGANNPRSRGVCLNYMVVGCP